MKRSRLNAVENERQRRLLLRAGADGRAFVVRIGHAERCLAVLALDQFSANLVGHREDLATTQIGAQQLNRHRLVSAGIYRPSFVGA